MDSRKFWIYTLASLTVFTLLLGWGVNRHLIGQRVSAVEERLALVNNLRREALGRYFETAKAELQFWSTNPALLRYQRFLATAWDEAVAEGLDPQQRLRQVYIEENPYPPGQRSSFADTPQSSPYRTMHSQLHPLTRKFVTERGYYDFFLVDPQGNVSYTVEKEDDFATNLLDGRYRDSALADVFRRAIAGAEQDLVVYSDFQPYAPSEGDPAMFMANAMHDTDGALLGVLVFQLPSDRIIHIMDKATEGTRTGEAYIVGEDLLMRTQSRFDDETTVLVTRVDTEPVERALNAEMGVMLADDYRGEPVYSAYSSVVLDQKRWALLVEMDRAEALEEASGQSGWLAGLLLMLYGLGAWSVWFLRGADIDADAVFNDFDAGMDAGD